MIKRVAVIVTMLALGVMLAPAHRAYAWPETIEAFMTAMQTGDAPGALAMLSDNAVLTLPTELVPPDSALLPVGPRAAHNTLTLSGKEQIGAWLTEFTGRYHGRIYLQGPARGKGDLISVKATVVADNLRDVFTGWPVGGVDLTLQGTHLTRVTLTLPEEDLRALRRANPQLYGTTQPAWRGSPNAPREC
jgi:hypothetical protein